MELAMHFAVVIAVTVVGLLSASVPVATAHSCAIARMKCAYRKGCGTALRSYIIDCASVLAGKASSCSTLCKRALISLTSTPEGKKLMACNCNGSEFCQLSKERVEICRPEVSRATAENVVVSCSVAHWICVADPPCSAALGYYHHFCRKMFHGYQCTHRCNNSLAILNRQAKAEKLRTCYCDGNEDFPCRQMRSNTERLCFGRDDFELEKSSAGNEKGHSRSTAPPKHAHVGTWALWVLAFISIFRCWCYLEIRNIYRR